MANKFTKTVNIENKPYEASIEVARHHDTGKENINVQVTIRDIVYEFRGTLDDIIIDLPIAVRSMILSEPGILLEYFENDIDIQFVDKYNALLILIKLIIGKNNYHVSIRLDTDDRHVLYNLVLVKVDELNGRLEEMQKVNDDKDVRIKTLEDRIIILETSVNGLLEMLSMCQTVGYNGHYSWGARRDYHCELNGLKIKQKIKQ